MIYAFRLFFLATSQHFGSIGGGTLFILNVQENGTIDATKSFEWTDGLFDTVSIVSRIGKHDFAVELNKLR